MDDWYTIEVIDESTYAISEYRHWEETHSYLLCGTERALLIDTGLGVSNIREVVDRLTSLPVIAAATHVHWDHIGGHKYFENIAVHEAERDWLAVKFPIPPEVVKKNLMRGDCGFPKGFRIDEYEVFRGQPKRVLRDGDSLDIGGRVIKVLHTPGHSPGHCCFYEPDRRYLYTGDLVYKGCLDAYYPSTDPWRFWQSVKKIQALGAGRILPGHHQLAVPVEIIGRIEEGFSGLAAAGKLKQGSGLYDFGEFQIHI